MSEVNNNQENINSTQPEKEDKINIKLVTICLSLFLLVGIIFSFTTLSYKSLLVDFKNNFDSAHYSSANNVLITKGNMNLLKSFKIDSDLTNYFKEKLNSISTDVTNGKVTSDDALVIVQEINRYNLLDTEIDKTVDVLSKSVSNSSEISAGISKYKAGEFKEALEIFKAIPETHEGYNTATDYIAKCKDGYIDQVLQEADKLSATDHYTNAINLLNEAINLVGQDPKISTKIDQLGIARDDYIATINN